jgi:aerobic carbon-monoxide dehydrogenase medium subunit
LRGPCAFAEVTPRLGGSVGEFATCGVAATIERDPDGTVTKARIALFGVAATPVRARSAEELLVGQWPEPGRLTAAAQATAAELSPLADVHAGPAYRRRLSRVLTERALTEMIS